MQFARFVNAATKNVTVDDDLSMADLRSEALDLRNLRGNDIVFITAPLGRFLRTPPPECPSSHRIRPG